MTGPKPRRGTRAAAIRAALAGDNGAAISELSELTGWKRPSVHGQLSAFRKRGAAIERFHRADGTAAYRLGADA
jgi:DNA-binding IclR family transcriptional regulator